MEIPSVEVLGVDALSVDVKRWEEYAGQKATKEGS